MLGMEVDHDKSVWGLGKLINELAKIKELESIRYTTSHPLDMDLDLLEAHRDIKNLCLIYISRFNLVPITFLN
jgi:tRNA A37 methylthiotransferase MiaB